MTTTQAILDHHLQAFGAGDLEAVMADYTDDSVLFTPHGALKGRSAIRELFIGMFAEFAKPGATFQMDVQTVIDDMAYICWSAETADNMYELGTDTFVVADGKIKQQTFAGKIVPKA